MLLMLYYEYMIFDAQTWPTSSLKATALKESRNDDITQTQQIQTGELSARAKSYASNIRTSRLLENTLAKWWGEHAYSWRHSRHVHSRWSRVEWHGLSVIMYRAGTTIGLQTSTTSVNPEPGSNVVWFPFSLNLKPDFLHAVLSKTLLHSAHENCPYASFFPRSQIYLKKHDQIRKLLVGSCSFFQMLAFCNRWVRNDFKFQVVFEVLQLCEHVTDIVSWFFNASNVLEKDDGTSDRLPSCTTQKLCVNSEWTPRCVKKQIFNGVETHEGKSRSFIFPLQARQSHLGRFWIFFAKGDFKS